MLSFFGELKRRNVTRVGIAYLTMAWLTIQVGDTILQKPNVMIMDEPTNHIDMESIEALHPAVENYPGTLIFISHDRDFVSSLATRVIEMTPEGIIDYKGSYDEYLRAQMLNQKTRAA